MTVETATSRAQYDTDGTTGPFTVPFYFIDEGDLSVAYTDAAGVDTPLALNVGYTVAGAGNANGGTITLATAYAAGGTITIVRGMVAVQETEYPESGPFPAKSHERALDRLTMLVQQLGEWLERAISFPASYSGNASLGETATRANKLLGFGEDGALALVTALSGSSLDLATQLAGTQGAGIVGYSRAAAYPPGSIGNAIKHLLPQLTTDYGAKLDGVADDTSAWQAALNDGVMFNVGPGVTKITGGLDWKHGSRAYGAGMWSAIASVYETWSTTVIQYAGAGGANSYVVKVSDAPMGTNPTTPSTRDMQNCAMNGFHIDGGDLAEFGLVEIRSWAGNDFDNISVSNCRKVACWAVENYVTGPRNRHLFKNRGAGCWLGRDLFSWGGSTTVDECTLIDWLCKANGCDQAGVPLNTFADTGGTNPTSANADVTCGLGIYGDRALTLLGYQADDNDGPNIYIATTLYPVKIINPYMEAGSKSSGASRRWAGWYASTGSSLGVSVEGGFIGSASGAPAWRLAGTSTSRPEQSFIFRGVPLVGVVDADDGFLWRLKDSDRLVADGGTLVITKQGPTNFSEQTGTSRSVANTGNVSFTTSAGAISALKTRGVCSGLTRTGAGAFTGSFGESDANHRYLVTPTALPSGWTFELGVLSAGSFTFTLKSGGVATDPNFYAGYSVIWDYD